MKDKLKEMLDQVLAQKSKLEAENGDKESSLPTMPSIKEANGGVGKSSYGDFQFSDFKYEPYEEGEATKAAREALSAGMSKKPKEYSSPWLTEISSVMDRILNREEFRYDVNADVLYQQYKDQYTALGKTAMRDAMGQASAMTGGYGNSWAATVGNHAYQNTLSELANVIPTLYEMAYGRYRDEGDALYDEYAMLSEREKQEYDQYRDAVSDWQDEAEALFSRYQSERDYDYKRYADERDAAYERYADEKGLAYEEYRNGIEDEQWQTEFEEEKRRYDEERAEEQRRYEEALKKEDEAFRNEIRRAMLIERVGSMSPSTMFYEMREYQRNSDREGLEEFLEICVLCNKLDESQANQYLERYGKSN